MNNDLDSTLLELARQANNLDQVVETKNVLKIAISETLESKEAKTNIIEGRWDSHLHAIASLGLDSQNYKIAFSILYDALTHNLSQEKIINDPVLRILLYENPNAEHKENTIIGNQNNHQNDLFREKYLKADNLRIELEQLISKTKETLADERARVNDLKQSLYEIRDGSYSEIQEAFNKLEHEKLINISNYRKALYSMGAATLFAPLLEIVTSGYSIYKLDSELKTWTDFFEKIILPNISIQIPIFAIFILSIYFFRIALNEYLSEKNELLQVQTRAVVCKFTPAFLAFGKGNEELLKEFKQYIYSPISTKECPTPLPTDTFTELVKSLKDVIPKIK